MKRTASIPLILVAAAVALMAGCEKDRSQLSDAELGLSPTQARGRRIYNAYCLNCHPAYSSRGNKGPGLKGLYKKEYLPSGLTPTDEHVEQSIVRGRNMMPGFGDSLSGREIQDLLAYLHTL